MPLPVYRLRRWLAVIAAVFTLIIAGMYLSARLRQRNVLNEVPGKIAYDIKQTASGFQFSKSEAGRTVFVIRASAVKEFKLSGRAELRNVGITLYGRDSSRFDQIYGDNFLYDPKTGDVTAEGDVQIDLEANPAGVTGADQAPPRELKDAIHLKTRDLVFNRDSGNASTDGRVDFRTAQAEGWAVGAHYAGKTNTLTLTSQIHLTLTGSDHSTLYATSGKITSDPHQILLDNPRMKRIGEALAADQATFFLRADNSVERVLAVGNVNAEETGAEESSARRSAPDADVQAAKGDEQQQQQPQLHARANQAELFLTGSENQLTTANLTGNVRVDRFGPEAMEGNAQRVVVDFAGENQVRNVHATEGVRLAQYAMTAGRSSTLPSSASSMSASSGTSSSGTSSLGTSSGPQDFELDAPTVDFFVADGRRLERAVTSGAASITITPAKNSRTPQNAAEAQVSFPAASSAESSSERTVITAGKFTAHFEPAPNRQTRITSMHGEPDAKIVNQISGNPDRVSTSQMLDAIFLAQGGIDSITQQGTVAYNDGQPADKRTDAWADNARYTPADQILVLTGHPRVAEGGMATTAKTIRINRATGDALADGDVKTAYSELKEQPNGALLASSSPIHVTAHTMTAHNSTAVALYTGNARLWQDANVISAPSIEFDRDRRFVRAQGDSFQPVTTVLVQSNVSSKDPSKEPAKIQPTDSSKDEDKAKQTAGKKKSDVASSVTVSSQLLTYTDAERIAHYEDHVVARGSDFTASSDSADAYLLPRSQTSATQSFAGPGQLDHMVAQGNVSVVQGGRKAVGAKLIYTASDERFVLTGGPPSIFDAERGKITGVSLTFFNRDDRVLVEGEASTPVVTQTRVAR